MVNGDFEMKKKISTEVINPDVNIKYLNTKYIKEEKYYEIMYSKVEPFLNNLRQSGYIKGQNKINIYYEKYVLKKAKGTIVISHGVRETLLKYNEIIYYFLKEGYSVYGLEHRGHGRSGYLGKNDKTQVNVEDFDYFVYDFKSFMDEVVIKDNNKNLYLFAHSMGGGIGSLFLEKYPTYFNKAILTSPMLQINTGKINSLFARLATEFMTNIGLGDMYVPGETHYSVIPNLEKSSTSCEARYMYYLHSTVRNIILLRSGVSYRGLKESFKASYEARDNKNIKNVKIPVLLFQSAKDALVMPGGQNKFAKKAENCVKVLVQSAKHEIYREKDEILFPYLDRIFKFLGLEQMNVDIS